MNITEEGMEHWKNHKTTITTTVDQIPAKNGPCNTNRYWDYDNSIEVRLDPSQDVNSQNIYEYYCKHWHHLSWPDWETYKDMVAGKIKMDVDLFNKQSAQTPLVFGYNKPHTGAATADTIGTIEIRTPERELVDMILKEEMSKILGPLSPDEERLVLHSREMANVPYPEPPPHYGILGGVPVQYNIPPANAPLNNAKPLTKTEQNLVDFCNSRLKPPQMLFDFKDTKKPVKAVEIEEVTLLNDGYRVTYHFEDGSTETKHYFDNEFTAGKTGAYAQASKDANIVLMNGYKESNGGVILGKIEATR